MTRQEGNIAGHPLKLEFGERVLESVQLGGADKGEVLGVEEKDDVFFSSILIERGVFYNLAIDDGISAEAGSGFSDEN